MISLVTLNQAWALGLLFFNGYGIREMAQWLRVLIPLKEGPRFISQHEQLQRVTDSSQPSVMSQFQGIRLPLWRPQKPHAYDALTRV